MGFLGVYKALYDYAPQSDGELAITEGDLLFVLEKGGEDDWWRAKKKASGDDDDEPVGLIPNNYIEEVCMHLLGVVVLPLGVNLAGIFLLLFQNLGALLDLPLKLMGIEITDHHAGTSY